MSWLRLDDGYDSHPKLLELTEQQRWRWTRVLIHCARHKTDGHVTVRTLRELGLGRALARLQTLELLEPNGDGDFTIHDWSTYNPKDPTKTARQARWRAKQASTDTSTPPSTQASTSPSTDASTETAENRLSRAGARARPVPSPTTPPSPSAEANSQRGRPDEIESQRIDPQAALAAILPADDDIPF